MPEKKLVVKIAGKKISLPAKRTEPTQGRPEIVVINKNPFVSAKGVPRRVKALFYGPTGTRKTRMALPFPCPAVVDLEDGTKWYADEFDFDVLPAIPDFSTYSSVVDWLAKGEHKYLTLVTDPASILWDMLQKQWSDTFLIRNIGGKGFKFDFYNMQPSDWKHVKGEWKDLMTRLMGLDMHVIFTARRSDLFADGELMRKIGEKPDGEKNMIYYFDIVLKFDKNEKGETIAIVEKDRTGKLPNVPFPMSYDVIEKAFGAEYLNREIDPSLMPKLASPENVSSQIEIPLEESGLVPDELPEAPDEEKVTEVPPTDVELPKEEGVLCPNCSKRVPVLKMLDEKKISVCKDCHKELSKPAGSTGKPIKITLKKGKKSVDKSEKAEKPKEAPKPALCTAQQEKDIREFCETLEISEKKMLRSLSAYDAANFKTLTAASAKKIITVLEGKLHDKQ